MVKISSGQRREMIQQCSAILKDFCTLRCVGVVKCVLIIFRGILTNKKKNPGITLSRNTDSLDQILHRLVTALCCIEFRQCNKKLIQHVKCEQIKYTALGKTNNEVSQGVSLFLLFITFYFYLLVFNY